MATEIEVVYSEIVEMSTLSKPQPEILLNTPSFADTQFDTYICMDGSNIKTEPVPTESILDRPHCSWQTQERQRSFEKFNTIEKESVQLEKVLRSFPNFDRYSSNEDIVPRQRNSYGQASDIPGK
ncbi:hypothetical protein TNIN_16061 [Trichonephila inaurata madagascariensis]|uniref:Uncharacterized protein n=1 Tax=Trichonephila inaurata madagascariensis TaxID=2747483 RepID=A0A8X6X336_9ARAC|nr:hypothetical protein TNIN_16061 [Trichonephila inaurata madagascariensis]